MEKNKEMIQERMKAGEKAYIVLAKILKYDCSQLPVSPEIINYYMMVSQSTSRTVYEHFISMLKEGSNCCISDHIDEIIKKCFMAGVVYVKEHPEVLDTIKDGKYVVEAMSEKEQENFKNELNSLEMQKQDTTMN